MKRRMKRLRIDLRRDWQLYVFLLLPLLYIVTFCYLPMGGIVMAFENFSVRKGIFGSDWVGLKHFRTFFESYYAGRLIKNTLILSLYTIVAGFPIPIIFALMLNSLRKKGFSKTTQTIACMPNFISTVVLVGILFQLFNSRTGLYGIIVERITGKYPSDLLGSSSVFRHMYVWSGVWQGFGWGSILYSAALSSVDPELHDAALIDGASRFQRVLYVDIPSIKPTIIITLILSLGGVMSVGFDKVFLMQNGLNAKTSSVISTYVYEVSLAGNGVTDYSYATAIGLFNSVVNLVMLSLANWIGRKVSNISLW